jgi:hypothetical protein
MTTKDFCQTCKTGQTSQKPAAKTPLDRVRLADRAMPANHHASTHAAMLEPENNITANFKNVEKESIEAMKDNPLISSNQALAEGYRLLFRLIPMTSLGCSNRAPRSYTVQLVESDFQWQRFARQVISHRAVDCGWRSSIPSHCQPSLPPPRVLRTALLCPTVPGDARIISGHLADEDFEDFRKSSIKMDRRVK